MYRLLLLACSLTSALAVPAGHPCWTRQESGVNIMECRGVSSRAQLSRDLKGATEIQSLHLEGATLDWIPGEELDALTVRSLQLSNSRIEAVDIVHPPVRHWSSLRELEMVSVDLSGCPDWQALLSGAGSLRTLHLRDVEVPTLGMDFRRGVQSQLQFLELRNTGTFEMEDGCLGRLKELLYLAIMEMPLRKVPRNALAAEMEQLNTLILSNNLLTELEESFFHGMPKLETLMISGNKFMTLDVNTFLPVAKQLQHLIADDNPIVCDCRLHWLLTTKSNTKVEDMKILATCHNPRTQELTDILDLDRKTLCSIDVED